MQVVHRFVTPPHECPYLRDRKALLEYSLAQSLSPSEYEGLMNTGYRKFGAFFFRPVCESCHECRPLRVPLDRFAPDRSQRRALERNRDLEVRVARPSLSPERLDLYNRYHSAQAKRKSWPDEDKAPEDYVSSFVLNPIPAIEVTVWEGERLVAVALGEVTPEVVSAVYHFHDLELSRRSLGTFAILQLFEVARRLEKPYLYLGFYVARSSSMAYKARFRPCELLGTDGVWRPLLRRP